MADRTAKLTIDKKTYLMTFGLGCLSRLNQAYQLDQNGFKVGAGIPTAFAELSMGNFNVVADIIRFSTADNVNRPTDEEIEAYIYECADDDDSTVFEDFLDYLKMVPGAKRFFNQAKQAEKNAAKQ